MSTYGNRRSAKSTVQAASGRRSFLPILSCTPLQNEDIFHIAREWSFVTKAELIEELAVRTEVPKAKVALVINTLCNVVTERVQAGEVVAIPPLGRFEYVRRAPRKARNPQTGETIDVPEKATVRFKPSAELKRSVN